MVHINIERLTFGLLCRCKGRVRFHIGRITDTVTPPRGITPHRHIPSEGDIAVDILTEQNFSVAVKFTDSKGKAAKVDGVPTWATDNSDILNLVPAADGMSCQVFSSIVPGAAKLLVSADADLGAGVSLVNGTLDVNVGARPATNVVLTPGPATDTP